MDKTTAVRKAAAYIESKGFETDGVSSLGDAIYLNRPGKSARLRIASYAHKHFDIAAYLIIDYREAWERDEQRVAWIGSDADLFAECDRVIAEYDANADDFEDEEDETI